MELTVVFRSDNPVVVGFAKELLKSNSVDFLVRNEELQSVIGIGSIGGYNPITGPIEILVREEDRGTAHDLLRDLVSE
jgi:hypothetical protein